MSRSANSVTPLPTASKLITLRCRPGRSRVKGASAPGFVARGEDGSRTAVGQHVRDFLGGQHYIDRVHDRSNPQCRVVGHDPLPAVQGVQRHPVTRPDSKLSARPATRSHRSSKSVYVSALALVASAVLLPSRDAARLTNRPQVCRYGFGSKVTGGAAVLDVGHCPGPPCACVLGVHGHIVPLVPRADNLRALSLRGPGPIVVRMNSRFTDELWQGVTDIYAAIVAHPFLAGLSHGSLPKDCFAFYVVQDALYLKDYARALASVASRAAGCDRDRDLRPPCCERHFGRAAAARFSPPRPRH